MSIKLRLALLLGLLLLVFLFCLLALRALEHRQLGEAIAAARRDDAELLDNWLELRTTSLRRFTEDCAGWPELAAQAGRPESAPRWVNENLVPLLPNYGIDALWLTDHAGRLIHSTGRTGINPLPPPVPDKGWTELAQVEASNRAYFFDSQAGLLEVRAIRLRAEPAAWLFAARLWDATFLARLGELTDSDVSIAPPQAAGIALALHDSLTNGDSPAPIVVLRPLSGWNGEALCALRLVKPAPDITFRLQADRLQTHVFLLFGLCLIGSLAVSLHQWVLRPLGWITDSLARHDTTPIQPLLKARTELTRVARLIVSSFEHREQLSREVAERRHAEAELQRTLEERARLGRDLHDGVIQSIYAAGLGLASARKKLPFDPQATERHLAQVAQVLNDTIREVRDFITGLEPETLRDAPFSHNVSRLFATMNASGTADADLDLDEAVAARFPLPLRTEILLLLREAISNALRHGGAGHVKIRLAACENDRDLALLEITDDGRGFDPATARRGRGLDNLFARAATHDAEAELHSAPGSGTRLLFRIPLPPQTEENHPA